MILIGGRCGRAGGTIWRRSGLVPCYAHCDGTLAYPASSKHRGCHNPAASQRSNWRLTLCVILRSIMDVDHFHELGPKLAKSQVGLVPKGKRDLRIRSQLGALDAKTLSTSCAVRTL